MKTYLIVSYESCNNVSRVLASSKAEAEIKMNENGYVEDYFIMTELELNDLRKKFTRVVRF